MSALPPLLMTGEKDSFARHTFAVRVPQLLDDLLRWNDYPSSIAKSIRELKREISDGSIRRLNEDSADRAYWDSSAGEHVGKSWMNVPWYWAEAYFYRRVLEATRYFQAGPTHRRDPYATPKRAELSPAAGPQKLLSLLRNLPADAHGRFQALLHGCLWGNRTDLSYTVIRDAAGAALALERDRAFLLADDTDQVWQIAQSAPGRIDVICDNAGPELLFDLALVDFLLHALSVRAVTLHVKPQPFFVSDAMKADVQETLDALVSSSAHELSDLGGRLKEAMRLNRLVSADHPFWATAQFFHELPSDLLDGLRQSDLAIFKGDANYRRLVGDCHWDPATAFADAARYMPVSLAAVRTLKAELIVGLAPGAAERLSAQDPAWQINGKRGVIQFHRN